jgi:high-affinity iron transporter
VRRAATIRICLATLAAVLALCVLPPGAGAQNFSKEDAIVELNKSRDLVERSVELYGAGKQDEAYTAARNAYLDHFEFVEIPLRVQDEAMTLRLEEDYAHLRNAMEDGAPKQEVNEIAGELRGGLDDVERELATLGIGAPLLAAMLSFVLLFREGLEAVLVVGAILGYLEASRNRQYRGSVIKGAGAAVVATAATFALMTLVLDVAPVQREILEAGTTLLAVAVLFYVSFWLISRLDHRRWMEFVNAKVWAAATTGATLALAGVGFTAVYREGFEMALMYQALFNMTEGLAIWVVVGAVVAAGVLAAVAYAIFKLGRRLPVRTFLMVAVGMVMALSVAFVGNAVRELQQAAVLHVTFLEDFPRLPIFLADLTGIHPTLQSLLAQAALAAVYIAGAIWMFVITPARERRAAAGAPPLPSTGSAPQQSQPQPAAALQTAEERAGSR